MLEVKAFIGLNDEKHGSEVVIVQENPLGGTISINLYLPEHQHHQVNHDLL